MEHAPTREESPPNESVRRYLPLCAASRRALPFFRYGLHHSRACSQGQITLSYVL